MLDYNPRLIGHNMQYSVRTTISLVGQLLFKSDTHYPLLTRGAGNTADIRLIMIDSDR